MRRSRRASAPGPPPTSNPPTHPGYGSWRGMESSGSPSHPPPDLPTPLGNPGRPPPARPGLHAAPTAAATEVSRERKEEEKDDRLRQPLEPSRRPHRSTMSPARRYAPTGWPPSVGMGGRLRRNPHPKHARPSRAATLPDLLTTQEIQLMRSPHHGTSVPVSPLANAFTPNSSPVSTSRTSR
jgi:hypothetical protein